MRGERRIDRRSVLRAAAGGAVLGAGAPFIDLSAQSASAKPLDRSLQPVLMAMHIHASFSEGIGSMEAHLSEAERTGVDVIWWTEHDHRMVARNYLNTLHFNGLYEWSKGAAVTWRSTYAGSLASSTATIVTDPVSADPGGKALRMTADSAGAAGATRTVTAAVGDGRLNTSIDGTTIGIDVYPQAIGDDSWFDIVVETSYRPARYERSGGQYRMRYRVGGGRPVGTVREVSPLDGLIVVDAPADAWTRLSLDLVPDFESLWPDIDFRDAALTNFSLAVTSRNSSATKVVVDGLTFDRRRKSPRAVLDVQRQLMDHYKVMFPTVVQQQGVEVSQNTPHLNWYGEPDIWPESDPAQTDIALAIEKIHQAGGVASYNHPFGTSGGPFSTTQRLAKLRTLTATMLREKIFDADVIEIGYNEGRAGMQQDDYVAIWDVLSRNNLLITAVGVTDDHSGMNWLTERWRDVTGVWTGDTKTASLQDALLRGRAWFFDLSQYRGSLDLLAGGYIPMGSAGLVGTDTTTLEILATDVPDGWRIVVISGVADQPGRGELDPLVTNQSYSPRERIDHVLTVTVPSVDPTFHRVVLRDSYGLVRAFSNPVWVFREPPRRRITKRRWAKPPHA